jgi:hypothetical protein
LCAAVDRGVALYRVGDDDIRREGADTYLSSSVGRRSALDDTSRRHSGKRLDRDGGARVSVPPRLADAGSGADDDWLRVARGAQLFDAIDGDGRGVHAASGDARRQSSARAEDSEPSHSPLVYRRHREPRAASLTTGTVTMASAWRISGSNGGGVTSQPRTHSHAVRRSSQSIAQAWRRLRCLRAVLVFFVPSAPFASSVSLCRRCFWIWRHWRDTVRVLNVVVGSRQRPSQRCAI